MRLAFLAVMLSASVAWAELDSTKDDYPAELTLRPMILPRWMFQLQLEGDLTNVLYPSVGPSSYYQGVTVGGGFDLGLSPRVQIGLYLQMPVYPLVDFGVLDANVQFLLVPDALNLRADLGVEREAVTFLGGPASHTASFVAGVGLPLRAGSKQVAFISGSTFGRRHATPFMLKFADASSHFVGAIVSDDFLTLEARNQDLPNSPVTLVGALHVPVGLLIQPARALALAVRSGYRLFFAYTPGQNGMPSSSATRHTVPLAFDLVVTFKRFDLGFTATILGALGNTPVTTNSVDAASQHWWDLQRYDLWIAARL